MIEINLITRELLILWFTFQVVKSILNVLRHDYKHWKQRLGIPDSWDFWFDPAVSAENKYRSWIWNLLTPFSDFWHTGWTLWQFNFVRTLIVFMGWSGLLMGVIGVFIVFNGTYNFLRYKKFIDIKVKG